MAAWRHILALGAPAGIVLEDDGILSRRLPEFLHHLGPSLPADIDLLKLETTRRHVRLGSAGRHLAGLAVRRLMGDHVGACGYVVSSVLAAHLLKVMQPASVPVDNILFSRRCTLLYSHRVYQVVPALTVQLVLRDLAGTQEIARSDLAGTRPDHSLPFKATRLRRISSNLRFSWRELNAFGTEVFNARTATPFADDA
jgi:GR25 family glycosyltransferase involved in LPS biosynthesis